MTVRPVPVPPTAASPTQDDPLEAGAAIGMRRRVFAAASWVMGSHLVSQAIRLGSNLVLTRLLAPDMFGVMSIAWVLMTGLTLFSDLGVAQNIVQHPRGADRRFLDTAWAVQIVRGVVIAAMVLLLAAALYTATGARWLPAGSVYASPVLHQVVLVLALLPVVSGCESINVALARRRLDFAALARLELTSQVAGTVCTVAMALATRSIWSLVAGAFVSAGARCYISHARIDGPRSRWTWDAEVFTEIIHFGKWIFLSSILGFFATSGDRLVLGAMVDSQTLGYYAIAFVLFSAVHSAVSKIVSGVTLPAFSEIVRTEPERLRLVFYRVRLPVDLATFFLAGFLYESGSAIVHLFYDNRYAPAGAMLEILSIALIALRYEVLDQCFLALGRPKLLTQMNAFRIAALYGAVPAACLLGGVSAAIWAIALSAFAGVPLGIALMYRNGLLDVRRELMLVPALPVGMLLGWLMSHALSIR